MSELFEKVNKVNTREDLTSFIGELITDYRNNIDRWENKTIEEYLEAMQGWIEDMDGYYQNIGKPMPENSNWNVFANILFASSMYE